jgi:glycogen debranching enzyme
VTDDPWQFGSEPSPGSPHDLVLVDGTTFAVTDERGDVLPDRALGLFVRDTRMLSRWQLVVAGETPGALHRHRWSPYADIVVASSGRDEAVGSVLVRRDRYLGGGMREEITLHNTRGLARVCRVELRVGADHADIFEVKEGRTTGDIATRGAAPTGITVHTEVDGWAFTTFVTADPAGAVTPDGLRWIADLPPHGSWTVFVEVHVSFDGRPLPLLHPRGTSPHDAVPARRRTEWRTAMPMLTTGHEGLARTVAVSVDDLGSLRIFDPDSPELPVVAAGAPWFMALFGRDALLSSLMTSAVDRSLVAGTVRLLCRHQGRRHDPTTEEQPGRILHELRFGPSTARRFGHARAYYGSVDATPLFVVAVGELLRWEGPAAIDQELLNGVDSALAWLTGDGDPDADGFVEYQRHSPHGLLHQGWKDSVDGVRFADGRHAEPPIALAEVQAYTFAAFQARAALAEARGDMLGSRTWRARAERLRQRFDEAFWMPAQGCYALALDADKAQVDAVTSNAGHCLWAGIALPERAAQVAATLTSPALFSGWGVRTLSTAMAAYDPMSYHNGSVWPHDTALCAAGLARYGYRAEAAMVGGALIDAAEQFGHRLPEVFCGFDRAEVPVAVPYAASCSPQAWSAAAPLQVLRTILGLEPDRGRLTIDPHLDTSFLPLRIQGLTYRGQEWALHVEDGRAQVVPVDPHPAD